MFPAARHAILGALLITMSCGLVGWLAVERRSSPPAPVALHLVVPPADETAAAAPRPDPRVLRVCSDPNNFPFSDRAQSGFENQLAELVARDLHRALVYEWQPQRRGFIRTALNAGRCDLVIGVPTASGMVRVTQPYYRSSYVFVSRRGRRPAISSFDDPRLRHVRIGIPITGEDYANPPAAQALAARHIVDNVRGYPVYGDYSQPRPSWGVLNAVLANEVDVAVAWGPLAGYFARHAAAPIEMVPVAGASDPRLPFAFDISMGVRRDDRALASAVDEVLARRATEIRRILEDFGVPLASDAAHADDERRNR